MSNTPNAPHAPRRDRFRRPAPSLSALLALVILLAGLLAATPAAFAQALPPNRFFGTVTIGGKAQPPGTVVEAYINGALCGSGTVQDRNGSRIYLVDVFGAGQKPGCGSDGVTVTFKIAGLAATESATYHTAVATHLDLTASGSPQHVSAPTVLPASGGGTPAPPPTPPPPTFSPPVTSSPPPRRTATPAARSASPTAPPSRTPLAIGPTVRASVSPSVSPSPLALSPTPALATPISLGAPTSTASPPLPVSASAPTSGSSSGPPVVARILIALALLAVAAGVLVLAYQRRRGA